MTSDGIAGMNGWEVAERIRAVDVKVPVVFITGWGLREEERARLSALRVQRCLFKPVRPDELDAAVQAAVASVCSLAAIRLSAWRSAARAPPPGRRPSPCTRTGPRRGR